MGYSISPASLRLDDLTEPIVQLLHQSGERSITIAPETGSDRLRRVINKTVTNDEILAATELIFANGIENLKLYYMIGLPTETDDDLVAIRDLTSQMRDIMMTHAKQRGRVGRIVGSVNPLIPKPGTAYQWMPMEDPAITDRKGKRLRQLLAGIDNVYFNIKSERHSYYQALCRWAIAGWRRQSKRRSETAATGAPRWRRPASTRDFYIFRDRSHDRVLPWDIIDGGMKQSFFRAELQKGSPRSGRCRRSGRKRTPASCPCCSSRHVAGPVTTGSTGRLRTRPPPPPRAPGRPAESDRGSAPARSRPPSGAAARSCAARR